MVGERAPTRSAQIIAVPPATVATPVEEKLPESQFDATADALLQPGDEVVAAPVERERATARSAKLVDDPPSPVLGELAMTRLTNFADGPPTPPP